MSDAKTPLVELHIIDKDISADNDEPDGQAPSEQGASDFAGLRQCQAFLIADRIRQMVGADTGRAEFKIYDRDNDAFRDVRYADIAVLMRSPAKRINDYIKIFHLLGVPVSTQASEFFEATEISDMLCLLRVLDNSQRDIELAAVLRSPLFSLTDTALAQIKIFSRESPARKSFYDSVLEYSINGPDEKLSEKLKNILDTLNRWRLLAKSGSIADLIWLIYRQSGLLSFVSALPGGPLRRSNLLKLHDRAVQFELFATSSAFLSLSRFVAFIEKLQQTEAKWASAEPEDLDQNAVLITSVHKSKGLEFPVVFLAELDDKFNYNDLSDDFLADPDLTFGLQVIDPASGEKISSLAHQVIAEKKLKSLLAEEMRILYVALTRATARLVLTGSMKRQRCCDILINGLFSQDASSAALLLESCKNYLEWILHALSDRKPLHDSFRTGFEPKPSDDNLFSFTLYNSADIQKFSNAIEKCRLDKKIKVNKVKPFDKSLQSQLMNQLKGNFSWAYQYQRSSLLPAKRTVTLITHNNNEFVRLDHSMALERKPKAYAPSKNLDIDARLAGQAVHLLISSLDLAHPVTKQYVQAVANELIERGFIDSNIAKTIDIDSILAFFSTDLGKMVFDSENSVFREWPFTISISASELAESNYESRATSHERQATSDDFIVVQGMIDMLIKTASGLVVIDFKSDNVTADRCFERAKIYRMQLDLYARAAADVFGLQVLKKCLYFLKPAKLIELP
jgi:ATP-dependent helicase/nuclease subunit A